MKTANDDLILHCEVCSNGGDRITRESEIAKIKELKFPFQKKFLAPLHEDRGETQVFFGTDWTNFRCPRGNHPIFILSQEDYDNFRKYGITRVLTNKGWRSCDIEELAKKLQSVREPGDVDDLVVDVTPKPENVEIIDKDEPDLYECKLCKNKYTSPTGINNHITKKHPKIRNRKKYIKAVVKDG